MRGIVRLKDRAAPSLAGSLLLVLAACGSTVRLDEPGAATSARPTTGTTSSTTSSTTASTTPARPASGDLTLPSPAVARRSPPAPPVLPGPPVPPQIAANFPEPHVTFATPAFEPGRTAYTSNDELAAILHGLSRAGGQEPHDTDIAVLPLGFSQAGVPIEALAFTRPFVAPAAPPMSTSTAPSVVAPPVPIAVLGGPPAPGAATGPSTPASPNPAPMPDLPTRRPAVVLLAGQHGDEPAGTEALLVVAQAIAAGRFDRVLEQVDIFVMPRANPDGAALGQREAADGSDVNRDHLLLRTPEAAAIAQLVRAVMPIAVLDLHEYAVDAGFAARFGAVQRNDALLQYATVGNEPAFVTKAAEEWFRAPLAAALQSDGLATDWYYTASENLADRKLSMGGVGADIGRNAQGLRNAVSLLVETRGRGIGRTDLKRRVQAGVVAAGSVLASAGAHAGDLVKLRQYVERDLASQACRGEAVLDAGPTPSEHVVAMIDADTGAIRRTTVAWDSSLELRVARSRPRPCGYWLAATESDAVRRLRRLGVEVQQVDDGGEVRGETYRETGFVAAADSADRLPRLRVQTQPVLLDLVAGSYVVSLEQPLANLAVAALEPESPYGYAANRVVADVRAEARVLGRPALKTTPVP